MDIQYILQVKDEDTDESIYSLSSFSAEVIEGSLGIAERLVEEYKDRIKEEKSQEEEETDEDLEFEQRLELESQLGCDNNKMLNIKKSKK